MSIHISVLMMVKNEQKRLGVTLESIKDVAKSFILYDTGSEDNTIQIARDFCKKNNIIFRLKEGNFVNFSVSRNISLDFADTFLDVDYLLLLDTNDELRNYKQLINSCEKYKDKINTGFLVSQEWWSGSTTKYFNIRLIKPREGWRYKGAIHEWIKNTKYESDEQAPPIEKLPNDIIIYQDRTQDDDKTGKRFKKDKVILLQEYKKYPTDTRTIFYLAQTCSCLNEHEDSFYYYKLRTTLDGFLEEKFHSMLKCAEYSKKLNHPWKETRRWYMNALELFHRAEPAIELATYYKNRKNWFMAYIFCSMACKLDFPYESLLFVDKHCYEYIRWHLLGIICYYLGFFEEGKIGCLKAIDISSKNIPNTFFETDNYNLKFYLKKEEELSVPKQKLTKKDFLNLKIQEIEKINPNLNKKQVVSKAKNLWKKQR